MEVGQVPLPKHVPDHREAISELSDIAVQLGSESGKAGSSATALGAHRVLASNDIQQKVALKALEARVVLPFVRYNFGDPFDVKISAESDTNELILTGEPRDIANAEAGITKIDKPAFAGMHAALIEPEFMSVQAFADQLTKALKAAGVKVSSKVAPAPAVTVIPHSETGEVFILAGAGKPLDDVKAIVAEIDAFHGDPNANLSFVYRARNIDAGTIAGIISAGGAPAGQNQALAGSVMLDPVNNRIIYAGPYKNYQAVRELLAQLDVKPKQVLIQATVAEVTLNDETQYGLEYALTHRGSNVNVVSGTKGGLGLAKTGFSYVYTGKNLAAVFQAYASNNKVNLLSRPRLFARSGTEATIQVGSDVPIISQVASSNIQNAGQSAILESVTYRQTGTILKIKPTVYGDRVDLTVTQEISAQQSDAVAAINSPVILKRSLTTSLALSEGDTAILGGLIEDQFTKGNGGIPLLKDLPIVGQAFRADTVSGSKIDLVLMLTPYIVDEASDLADITNTFDADLNRAFKVGRGFSYTLMPWATGHSVGVNLPSPHPGSRGQVTEGNPPPPK